MDFTCSTDARKVFNKYPIFANENRIEVERALFTSLPSIFNQVMKKYNDPAKVIAMIKNGYRKVDRGFGEGESINWDDIIFHYYYLTEKYLKVDFSYSQLFALNDISKFSFKYINKYIYTIKVKNLWYLRKVLSEEAKRAIEDVTIYKDVSEIALSEKGNVLIDKEGLEEYAK